jgi:hypothetical protein
LAWQLGLVGVALAALSQSLLAPRWPRAELPAGFGRNLRLAEQPLRLTARLPGRRDRDLAVSNTLVFEAPGAGPQQPALELRVLAVQTRHRSDLAVPRLVRDRPDLRLRAVTVGRQGPQFSYARGVLNGRPACRAASPALAKGAIARRSSRPCATGLRGRAGPKCCMRWDCSTTGISAACW